MTTTTIKDILRDRFEIGCIFFEHENKNKQKHHRLPQILNEIFHMKFRKGQI